MLDVKNINFEINHKHLSLYISEESKLLYDDMIKTICDKNLVFDYLKKLFCLIDSWQEEYTDTRIIDGIYWKLTVTYLDGKKKEYKGRSSFPTNFEAFERLNQKLINEVQNG